MLKTTAISTAAIIAVVAIDWLIMNGYRELLILPLTLMWLGIAIGLTRFFRNNR